MFIFSSCCGTTTYELLDSYTSILGPVTGVSQVVSSLESSLFVVHVIHVATDKGQLAHGLLEFPSTRADKHYTNINIMKPTLETCASVNSTRVFITTQTL